MDYDVLRSTQCAKDLEQLFEHLYRAYVDLGDDPQHAFARAVTRLNTIEDAFAELGATPFQGTLVPHIMEGMRHVTKERAVFYFIVNEQERQVKLLGVFFGGQDHRLHILRHIASVSAT